MLFNYSSLRSYQTCYDALLSSSLIDLARLVYRRLTKLSTDITYNIPKSTYLLCLTSVILYKVRIKKDIILGLQQ
jgi:hypothetical protein